MNMWKLEEDIPHPERGSVDFEISSFSLWWVGSATWSLRCLLKSCQGVEQGDSVVSVMMMKGVSSDLKCHLCLQKAPMSDKRANMTNLRFGAKGQYLSFPFLMTYFLVNPVQSGFCHERPSDTYRVWVGRSLHLWHILILARLRVHHSTARSLCSPKSRMYLQQQVCVCIPKYHL